MKHMLLLIFFISSIGLLQAQEDKGEIFSQYTKGKVLLGASLGFHDSDRRQPGQLFYDLDAKVRASFFIKDQWMLGIGINKTMSFSNPAETTFYRTFINNPTHFTAFTRYYISGKWRINPYVELGGGTNYVRPLYSPTDSTLLFGGNDWMGYAELGASIPLGKRVSIDLGVQHRYIDVSRENFPVDGYFEWTYIKLGTNLHLR